MKGTIKPSVLVLDASGTIGAGIVSALLASKLNVIAVGADQERLDQLSQCPGRQPNLDLLHASLADDDGVADVVRRLRARGDRLSAVVASLGSPLQSGRLLDQASSFLRDKLNTDLITHLSAARHLLAWLGESESSTDYVLIGGPCAQQPWSGYGHASVSAAALQMLAKVLHSEAQSLGVRVQLLAVDRPIATPANQTSACPEWTDAVAVGHQVVQLLQRQAPPRPIVPYVNSAPVTPMSPRHASRIRYEVY